MQSLNTLKYMYGNTNMKNWGVKINSIERWTTWTDFEKFVGIMFKIDLIGDHWNSETKSYQHDVEIDGELEIQFEFKNGVLDGYMNLINTSTGEIRQSKRRKFNIETLKWVKGNGK